MCNQLIEETLNNLNTIENRFKTPDIIILHLTEHFLS